MTFDTIIVGAGMAGLSAAAALAKHGHKALVLEARDRIGGRILSLASGGKSFDLGPSWVWPGQPLVAAALKEHAIATFAQYSDGALIYQQADGRCDKHPGLSPMANALRIDGGPSALIDAFAAKLAPDQIQLNHQVTAISHKGSHITVFADSSEGPIFLDTKHLALALSPRLCASIHFDPALSGPIKTFLDDTPTWMAAHAKFTALYDTPFWRSAGLSGSAMSRRGPMVEIHDISPPSGGHYALFGFVGLDAAARKKAGSQTLHQACLDQLGDIFGPPARSPIDARLQDWSEEPFTATPADQAPLAGHPTYGLHDRPDAPWVDSLHFISAEAASDNGGLIEGALQCGAAFANHVLAQAARTPEGTPRTAGMSWDWLDR